MIGVVLAIMITVDPVAASTPIPAPAPEKSPLQIARDNLDKAQDIYTQSCGDRAYGAYDDLCEQLSTQLRQYRIDVDKLERAAAVKSIKPTPIQPKS